MKVKWRGFIFILVVSTVCCWVAEAKRWKAKETDPDIGEVHNVASCYACGMRGHDSLRRDWPDCKGDYSQYIDTCGGGRMRCYVLYGAYDWENFGRTVISKGCTYATYFQFISSRRRKRDTVNSGLVEKTTTAVAATGETPPPPPPSRRSKRHIGMLGSGTCGFLSSQMPVYYGWNLTLDMHPMCMCDDKANCNNEDWTCHYDPQVCRNHSTPSPEMRVRRGMNAASKDASMSAMFLLNALLLLLVVVPMN
ncbi:unnamed protein product [Notodromas monacha]|uniref:Uncharacterized protein n=1 Tax=Notodromas monacha TaxID=399045 RepID=A0A7R9GE07_9CRUS|nr:unnamed protein product [Notodromas monacha]CAG0917765.1 unnamed protein product [Notodromas monacha]